MTADAIAEERERPLMMISAELGTNAEELEGGLTDILEISKVWRAILLLDEAEVFLEARSLNDLHRNAMVTVFLRLLEYHQPFMFLTTNQVSHLDDAFKSRISIANKYKDLDQSARREIWQNFLYLAHIRVIDGPSSAIDDVPLITTDQVNRLASQRLNGQRYP